MTPGTADPPAILLLDPLGSNDLPEPRQGNAGWCRAILERKYGLGATCAVGGRLDPTIRSLREPRYTKSPAEGRSARA
mgnify:CR=1 FL=1